MINSTLLYHWSKTWFLSDACCRAKSSMMKKLHVVRFVVTCRFRLFKKNQNGFLLRKLSTTEALPRINESRASFFQCNNFGWYGRLKHWLEVFDIDGHLMNQPITQMSYHAGSISGPVTPEWTLLAVVVCRLCGAWSVTHCSPCCRTHFFFDSRCLSSGSCSIVIDASPQDHFW